MKAALAACCLLLTGCATAPAMETEHPLGWISGCWENADGDYREVWSAPDHGYLFGYALSLKGGTVSFFEQSRIEPGKAFTFAVYPGGKGPLPFGEIERGASHIVFADPDHDYPQRIRYAREGDRMTAEISLMDGSRGQGFAFRRCSN
jgi:hypothetical protein